MEISKKLTALILSAVMMISAVPAVISGAQSYETSYSFDETAAVRIKSGTVYNFRQDKGTRIVLEYTAQKDILISLGFTSEYKFDHLVLLYDSSKKRIYPVKKDTALNTYIFNLQKGKYYLIIDDVNKSGIDMEMNIKEGSYRGNLYQYSFDNALTFLREANKTGTALKMKKKYNVTVRSSSDKTSKYYKFTAEKNGKLRINFSFGDLFYRTIFVLYDETGKIYYPTVNISYPDITVSDDISENITVLSSGYYDQNTQAAYNTKWWEYDLKKGNYYLMIAGLQGTAAHSRSYKFTFGAVFNPAPTPPAAPKLKITTKRYNTYKISELSWNSVPDAERYIIYSSEDNGKTYRKYKTVKKNKTTYKIKMNKNTSLKFYVKSVKTVNGKIMYSKASNIVSEK